MAGHASAVYARRLSAHGAFLRRGHGRTPGQHSIVAAAGRAAVSRRRIAVVTWIAGRIRPPGRADAPAGRRSHDRIAGGGDRDTYVASLRQHGGGDRTRRLRHHRPRAHPGGRGTATWRRYALWVAPPSAWPRPSTA